MRVSSTNHWKKVTLKKGRPMNELMGAAAGIGTIGYLIFGIMILMAPLGIWSAVSKTNRLLLEQNLRLCKLAPGELPCRTCAAKGRVVEMVQATVEQRQVLQCPHCKGIRKIV